MKPEDEQDTVDFETEISKALEQGQDIQEAVRRLVLKKMTDQSRDLAALRRLTLATLRGFRKSVQRDLNEASEMTEQGKRRLREGLGGLDEALGQFALASRLAIQEASGRTAQASREEYQRLREDLERLDSMFAESLHASVVSAHDQVSVIFEDFKDHLKRHGSKTAHEAKEALGALAQGLGKVTEGQGSAALSLARESARLMCMMASGGLEAMGQYMQKENGKQGKS